MFYLLCNGLKIGLEVYIHIAWIAAAKAGQMSPWNALLPLWLAAAPAAGQISCVHPANGSITIVAQDGAGTVILTQVVSHGRYADISPKKAHEQTRMALTLVLKAIHVLEKQK